MSLDLHIYRKQPVEHLHTGIFYRKDGADKEVLSLDEFHQVFPGHDDSEFELFTEENNEVWWQNITHNMCKMAEHIYADGFNFYQLLWHPKENGFTKPTETYKQCIYDGLIYMIKNQKELEKYNPENGWGSYDSFLSFVVSYARALGSLEGDDYEICASV